MLLDTLQANLLASRKARDTLQTNLLTALVGEAAMVGKNAGNRVSSDDEVMAVIKKFLKNAQDTKSKLEAAGRDSSDISKEIAYLTAYLPQQMTSDQIKEAVTKFVGENAGTNMGAIMKYLKENFGGKYDAKAASEIVKGAL